MTTKLDLVRKHLMTGRDLTPLHALSLYSIQHLAPRILDLRREGYIIDTLRKVDETGTRYAAYKMRMKKNGKPEKAEIIPEEPRNTTGEPPKPSQKASVWPVWYPDEGLKATVREFREGKRNLMGAFGWFRSPQGAAFWAERNRNGMDPLAWEIIDSWIDAWDKAEITKLKDVRMELSAKVVELEETLAAMKEALRSTHA